MVPIFQSIYPFLNLYTQSNQAISNSNIEAMSSHPK